MRHLRIGTRGSLLAKWQAEYVRKQLFAGAGVETEIVIIKTLGDKQHMSPLSQIGGKENPMCWTVMGARVQRNLKAWVTQHHMPPLSR